MIGIGIRRIAMNNRYCPYCMAKISEEKTCPQCGKQINEYIPAPHHLLPGTVLKERYVVGKALGEGGFGITYVGFDETLNIKIAIKEYYPNDRVVRNNESSMQVIALSGRKVESYERGKQKFLKEAKTMARMEKQHTIVGVKDYFEQNNTAYIVMEFINGQTLKEICGQRKKGMAVGEVLDIMEPVFYALDDLHEEGMIHRDISPDNMMLEDGQVRLLDFGCAKETSADEKTSDLSSTVVKHGYAPVEQYSSQGQGPWTDVYSLSATIYYLITGTHPPYSTDRMDNDPLIPPSKMGVSITKSQEAALLKGMAPFPKDRYGSMKEFHDDLYKEVSPPPPIKIYSAIAIACILLVFAFLRGYGIIDWPPFPTPTPEPTEPPIIVTPTPSADTIVEPWERNLLRADPSEIFTITEENEGQVAEVFGSGVKRSMIKRIYFKDSTESLGENAWDVSGNLDGSVMAYLDQADTLGYWDLYICADGGINAKDACKQLFSGYTSVESIDFGGCFHIDGATDLTSMFGSCYSLKSLDLSGFDTKECNNMRAMFYRCNAIETIKLDGFDTSNVTDMYWMFVDCTSLQSLDLSNFRTAKCKNMENMFGGCTNLKNLDVSGFDTKNVESMKWMFAKCESLESLDIANFKENHCTTMYCMFSGCKSLQSLDLSNLETDKCENMAYMFYGCESLDELKVSSFKTANVQDMTWMFYKCKDLKELNIASFETGKCTSFDQMFCSCESLTQLELDPEKFDTRRVTNMQNMFYGCKNLESIDVSKFNTENCTTMYGMFYDCNKLKELKVDGFDTSNVTTMKGMFCKCSDLEALNVKRFKTKKCTDMKSMFSECERIQSLDVSEFDISNVTDMSYMFNGCTNLELDISNFVYADGVDTTGMTDGVKSVHR